MVGRAHSQFKETFLRTVQEYHLLEQHDRVLVGVSGGSDSLSLLHLLVTLQRELSIEIGVAHLNHGLRGVAAEQDAQFVRMICEAWDIPCEVGQVDTQALAKAEGLSKEEAARGLRYAFYLAASKRVGSNKIAVGHTADDQVETILMRFLRGAGVGGLSGMPRMRRLHATQFPVYFKCFGGEMAQSIFLIRPLLTFFREEVLAYLLEAGLTAREDESNADLAYTRNRIRHQVIPYLTSLNPNLKTTLLRMAQVFEQEEQFCRELLEREGKNLELKWTEVETTLRCSALAKLPDFLKWHVVKSIHAYWINDSTMLSWVHFQEISKQLGKKEPWMLYLPGPLYLEGRKGRLTFSVQQPSLRLLSNSLNASD